MVALWKRRNKRRPALAIIGKKAKLKTKLRKDYIYKSSKINSNKQTIEYGHKISQSSYRPNYILAKDIT